MNKEKRSLASMLRPALRVTGLALLLLGLSTIPSSAQAFYSVLLNMPEYSEEALTWCGPAAAEMAMAGYPVGACLKTQDDIWQAILANRVENNWDSDPAGMRGAMKNLCPPQHGWSLYFVSPDEASVMYSVAHFMALYKYPVLVVLNTQSHNSYKPHQEHWVTIRGIVTDKDPTANPPVPITLEYVWFVDPAPPNLGDPPIDQYVSANIWKSEFQAVTKAGSAYQGEYVAVIEPPERPGRVIIREQVTTGKIIPAAKVLQFAAKAIARLKLADLDAFRSLAESKPLEPILVNPQKAAYYVIPYSRDGNNSHLAILINAYSGEFQEIAAFRSRKMLSQHEAIELAAKNLHLEDLSAARAVSVYAPEYGAEIRYLPAWQVELGGKMVLLDESGRMRRLEKPLNQ
jgi:hypothetical protein